MSYKLNSMKAFILIFCVALVSVGIASAKKNKDENLPKTLKSAVDLFQNDEPEEAFKRCLWFMEKYPDSKYTAFSLILAGRCDFALGNISDALSRCHEVLKKYPGSDMSSQAYYLIASAYQSRGDSYEAARALINCLDGGDTGRVKVLAEENLIELLEGPLAYKLDQLREFAQSEASMQALYYVQAPSSIPRIGLLVDGAEEDSAGRSLVEGIRAALSLFDVDSISNDELISEEVIFGEVDTALVDSSNNVELITEDGIKSEVDAVLATRRLIREEGVCCIIAGLDKSKSVIAAVESQSAGIPIILPGSRYPGLYAIGATTIQPEADWFREGEIAGIYAVDSLGLRSFAIVAPATEMCRQNVSGFMEVIDSHDSTEMISLEWYFPSEGVSLSRQFLRIREIAFRREFADSLTQKEVEFDSTQFEKLWRSHLDSIRLSPSYKSGSIDSNSIDLATIDAFYFPIEPGTMELFAPQVAFYNFRTQMFGNSAWYDKEELYRHRQYVEDMVFTTPYNLDGNSEELIELSDFLKDSGVITPDAWHIRGFDAASIVLGILEDGYSGTRQFSDRIRRIEFENLASGHQTFSEEGLSGQSMWFLTIIEGEVHEESAERRRIQILQMKNPDPNQPNK
ncbi:MAG: hypothetical protein P9L92_01000 [Candidatus Electryonea clarkiae]|nr:hypothetical protein [Candidatus Electryonea clarkiae]MDP8288848.1 hypothetical protein [Candidatus Electryonea clarkiae]